MEKHNAWVSVRAEFSHVVIELIPSSDVSRQSVTHVIQSKRQISSYFCFEIITSSSHPFHFPKLQHVFSYTINGLPQKHAGEGLTPSTLGYWFKFYWIQFFCTFFENQARNLWLFQCAIFRTTRKANSGPETITIKTNNCLGIYRKAYGHKYLPFQADLE